MGPRTLQVVPTEIILDLLFTTLSCSACIVYPRSCFPFCRMTDAMNGHVTLMSDFAAPAGMSQIYDL